MAIQTLYQKVRLAFQKAGFSITATSDFIADWVTVTVTAINDWVKPTTDNDHYYVATVAGTTGGSEPTFPTTIGDTVVDATVTWQEANYHVYSLMLDAIYELSKHYPRLRINTSNDTDGTTKSFALPSDFLDLDNDFNSDPALHPTGVQTYDVGGDSEETSDVSLDDFRIERLKTSNLVFFTAPDTGSTLKIYYQANWDIANLPDYTHQAIVLFAQYFCMTSQSATGMKSKEESDKKVDFFSQKDLGEENLYQRALDLIKSFPLQGETISLFKNIRSTRV